MSPGSIAMTVGRASVALAIYHILAATAAQGVCTLAVHRTAWALQAKVGIASALAGAVFHSLCIIGHITRWPGPGPSTLAGHLCRAFKDL